MANSKHLKILKNGVEAWNMWRHTNPTVQPDLRNADLSKVNFDVAIYNHPDSPPGESADPNGVDFVNVLLDGVRFGEIEIWMPEFEGASISGASFGKTRIHMGNFRNASLKGSDLLHTQFWNCNMTETDFNDAVMWDTLFSDIDLSSAIGLESVRQQGPSQITISSLYRSGGFIPDTFLRGAGVPEQLITYLRSHVDKPVHLYSCFISHSSKDQQFCNRLAADMRAREVQVWYFPEDAVVGNKVWGEIDQNIRNYDKVVVVCSQNSLVSGPVRREIERALNREDRENREVLCPIRIDDYIFTTWDNPRKADVVEKFVGDFTGWSTDSTKYEAALNKLIEALKSEKPRASTTPAQAGTVSSQPNSRAADLNTWKDFIVVVPGNGSMGFLRERNFAGFSFDWRRLGDIERFLYERSGPEHEFLDPTLEKARKNFQKSIKTLLSILATNTFPTHHEDYQSIPEHWETEYPERFNRAVAEIHKSADAVCASYDSLVRIVRETLVI